MVYALHVFLSIPSLIFGEKLSITASLNLRYEQKLFFEFNQSSRILRVRSTAFQVLKLQFLACSMIQAFYSLYKQNTARA